MNPNQLDTLVRHALRRAAGAEPADLDTVTRAVHERVSRRRRTRVVTATVMAAAVVIAGAAMATRAFQDGTHSLRFADDPPPSSAPGSGRAAVPGAVRVPSVIGMRVDEAHSRLKAVGLTLGIEPQIDSDDPRGTVIAQKPEAGLLVPAGSLVGARTAAARPDPETECEKARTSLDGSTGALPEKGMTELGHVRATADGDRAELIVAYQATMVAVAHRGGDVNVASGTGPPRIERVDDYQILVELPRESCPGMPQAWKGIPVVFVPS